MSYQFFTEADIDPVKGTIKSEYPMWYNPKLVHELEDEVMSKEAALETGAVPRGLESDYRDNLNRLKGQLAKMQNMSMVDDAKNDRATLGKAISSLGKIIAEELPREDLCRRGLVDPNQEYRKMTDAYIPVKDENIAELAKACNVPIRDGKISREGACKMWKIGTKFMGDYANTEILRKQ